VIVFEHICLPTTFTFVLYNWMVYDKPSHVVSLVFYIHNNVFLFLILMAECWFSKIPLELKYAWGIGVYVVGQVFFVLVFWAFTHCYLVRAVDYNRNIVWLSYPGYFSSYFVGFGAVYCFTQVRDFAQILGQETLRPMKSKDDKMILPPAALTEDTILMV